MVPSATATDNPVEKQVTVVEVEVLHAEAEAEAGTEAEAPFFIAAFFFLCVGHLFTLAGRLMATLGRLCFDYFPQLAFGEQAVIMPPSSLTFLITALLALAEIKSQGETNFPFQTHAHAIIVSVNSLLIYGLASAAEVVISAAEPGCQGFRNTMTTTAPGARDCLQPLTKSFTFY